MPRRMRKYLWDLDFSSTYQYRFLVQFCYSCNFIDSYLHYCLVHNKNGPLLFYWSVNVPIEITEEMEVVIRRALNPNANKGEILNECNRIQIKRSDILTLKGSDWLNDEVYLTHLNMA